MAPSVRLVLLLSVVLSLAGTPASSAPAHPSSASPRWPTRTARGRRLSRSW
uniref:Galanin like peptide n=1 Tax=Propithecus coquereli TaxID=379532 RepID=A0A2K6F0U2_PROCO